MTEMIKAGDFLPDISVKAIVKDEIKDVKLSLLFADHSLMHPKDKKNCTILSSRCIYSNLLSKTSSRIFNLCKCV